MKNKTLMTLVAGLLLASPLTSLSAQRAEAAITTATPTATELANSTLSTHIAEEGMVLLQNKAHSLPLKKGSSVALFGSGAYGTYKGGSGSGDVNPRHIVNIWDGLKQAGFKISSESWLQNLKQEYDGQKSYYQNTLAKLPFAGNFAYQDKPITDQTFASIPAETGIYIISRSSGEGNDRKNSAGDYQLTTAEMNNIKKMSQHYQNSIVLLNVGGVIDTSFIDEAPALKGLLLVSQAGQNTGTAVANILTGKVTPSGKLSDTWARQYSDYPAAKTFANNDGNAQSEKYTEGIYVGYRYFDTYNVTPRYQFGYGLSYTDFSLKTTAVDVSNDEVTVKTQVKNTGKSFHGRDVVQVYVSAPRGNVPTAMQDLAGFAKTKELAPGKTQTVTIKFKLSSLASYNERQAAYQLGAGFYLVRVGDDSRNTHVAAQLHLGRTITTKQLANENQPDIDPTILKGSSASFVPENQQQELSRAKKIELVASAIENTTNQASKYDPKKVTTYVTSRDQIKSLPGKGMKQTVVLKKTLPNATLKDVYDGKITMPGFVAGLTTEQLSKLVEGNVDLTPDGLQAFIRQAGGGVIGGAASVVPGAAGQTTETLQSLGIPAVVNADGPAGIRLPQSYEKDGTTYYNYATAWPIGTLVAQTWDPERMYQMGEATAKEMKLMGITTWLTPGMNIHRDPLGGRNFEYFSEDPLLTGIIATAETRGVQQTPGIGVAAKHFAVNSQETNRMTQNSDVGEQALRQIYLKGFQIVVENAQPQFVMSSYNQVNGRYNSANYQLLTNILRGEWGFKGAVMSDWDNLQTLTTPWDSLHAGNDIIFPGGSQFLVKGAVDLHGQNTMYLGDLQTAAMRILAMIMNSDVFARQYGLTAHSLTPSEVTNTLVINGQGW